MDTTAGLKLILTRTACKKAVEFGWDAQQIKNTFENPKAVYKNNQREGQYRIAGHEIVIVGTPTHDGKFIGITMFRNGSSAPKKSV